MIDGSTAWQAFGALALVLGLLMALRLALLKLGVATASSGRRIRVVESHTLGARARLHLVEVDGRELLIGSGDPGLQMLHRCAPAPAPVEDPEEGDSAAAANPAIPANRLPRLLRHLSVIGLFLLVSVPAWGQESGDLVIALPDSIEAAGGASILEMLAILTILGIAPSILLMATCFTRIVIVLAFVRQAIGVQHMPPNQVLVGLALFLTFFVMAPVGEEIARVAYDPYVAGDLTPGEALRAGAQPVRTFLLGQTREEDLALFVEISGAEPVAVVADIPLTTLLPSFLVSELRKAFEIGFVVFLPFLVIDLVVSSMLISMGMIVLPPIVVSLPFKIMLFVLVDGWNLILGSLVRGLS